MVVDRPLVRSSLSEIASDHLPEWLTWKALSPSRTRRITETVSSSADQLWPYPPSFRVMTTVYSSAMAILPIFLASENQVAHPRAVWRGRVSYWLRPIRVEPGERASSMHEMHE